MTSETTKVKKGKASAKRNSEARREQNRLASRNYRGYFIRLAYGWLMISALLTPSFSVL
jgi:hypothetical protein